jgi:hypothetical protein
LRDQDSQDALEVKEPFEKPHQYLDELASVDVDLSTRVEIEDWASPSSVLKHRAPQAHVDRLVMA